MEVDNGSPDSSAPGTVETRHGLRAHWVAIGWVVLLYALAIATYHPFANLTYGGDDFAYAWSAYRLVIDGKIVASSWVTAAAVPQMLWGAAFCKVFGLSFVFLSRLTQVVDKARGGRRPCGHHKYSLTL